MGQEETAVATASKNPSGLICLHSLVVNLHRNVNFDALITDRVREQYSESPCEALMSLAEELELRPERKTELLETAGVYSGPALVRMKSDRWVCLPKFGQLAGAGPVHLYDPLIQGSQKTVQAAKDKILSMFDGELLIFRNLQPVDNAKFSGLFCLSAIARHHQVAMDSRRLLHDYALGEEEPTVS